MRRIYLIALLTLAPGLGWAAFSSSNRGTSTADFLKLGAGARQLAMGEAGTALSDDANAMYWNPADLLRIPGKSAVLMHAPYIDPTYYDFGAYAQRVGYGALGFSWQHFSAGTIHETDPYGKDAGEFSPSDTALTLGGAVTTNRVPGLFGGSFGVNAKYIRSTIIQTAHAWAMDAGLTLPPQAEGRWHSAIVVTNLGTSMKFEQAKEPLPLTIRLGQSFDFDEQWTGAFDLDLPRDNNPYAAFGMEYHVPLSGAWGTAFRAGYNTRTSHDLPGSGATLGAGLTYGGYTMDYAFLPMGPLGITHRISLGFRWGEPPQTRKIMTHPKTSRETVDSDDIFQLTR